ncbi:MAG: hypothetical protein ACRDI2_16325 [Chloroflexota bacterium]
MPDQVPVELNPSKIEIEPGAAPVQATVTIQNLGDVVEQYNVEVDGLDSEWFTAPVAAVGLFPGDQEQVRISFHPPKREGMRAGAYPFRVVVRGRNGIQEIGADGVLDVRGTAIFRLDMTPRRQTARGKGSYRLKVINSGGVDVELGLEARDAEEACTFAFRDEAPSVAAGKTGEVPFTVRPKSRPWVGQERSYEFMITARPQNARGQSQSVSGQFTHRPLFRDWGWLRRTAIWTGAGLLALVLVSVVLPGAFGRELGFRAQVAWAQTCGRILFRIPVVGPRLNCAPGRLPTPDAQCVFERGFKIFAEADPQLVGNCTTSVVYDNFGNGLQFTDRGVLFWQKDSNTVYFFINDSVFAYLESKPQLLHGSGRR